MGFKRVAWRVGEVLTALFFCLWIGGMVRLAFTLTTWPFRVLAGVTAAYLTYQFVRFLKEAVRA